MMLLFKVSQVDLRFYNEFYSALWYNLIGITASITEMIKIIIMYNILYAF